MMQKEGTGQWEGVDAPALVVEPSELSGMDESLACMRFIPGSRMFEIRDALKVYREKDPGGEMFDASQGDGGSSLPGVPPEILEEAHAMQRRHGTGYDKPYGTDIFREAVVDDYWKLESSTGWGRENVIAGQGGRDALIKAYDAMLHLGHKRRGDFIITTRVPWISYNWGPYSVGANVILAPGDEGEAWRLTPEGVKACVEWAAQFTGRKVAGLIITSPDNPTGRTLSMEEQLALARTAFRCGIPFVFFDWIYHQVTDEAPYDINILLNALDPEARDRCIILDGITKSLGGSNIRNAHLLASRPVIQFIQKRASHGVIPSFYSQAVAIVAYRMGYKKASASIVEPTNASRVVLKQFFRDHGMKAITGKGYYAFIHMAQWIQKAGMRDSADLGKYLAEDFGLAVVPGVYFSRFASQWIRFSYALPPERTAKAAERLWVALNNL